ncbi:MAG: hypothetical protein GTO14_04875 [Anaerolineales bacterium]|nr:hypothetical protein [Anaerolineales bacterium]
MKGIPNRAIFLLLFILLLLSSCSAKEERVDPVDVDEITVYFEPENCRYDGPPAIKQGEVTLIFDNLTEANVTLRVYKLEDDKTWQDFEYHYREGKTGVSFPSWASIVSHKPVLSDPRLMIINFEPGSYAMACAEILEGTWANWLAAPLEVR